MLQCAATQRIAHIFLCLKLIDRGEEPVLHLRHEASRSVRWHAIETAELVGHRLFNADGTTVAGGFEHGAMGVV